MLKLLRSAKWLSLFCFLSGCASVSQADLNHVVSGQSNQALTWDQALAGVSPGDVVVLGEEHGTVVQPQVQVTVMQTLRQKGLKVSVGLEFFYYPQQALVDSFRNGQLTEAEFLKQINWTGFPFSSYRAQALFATAPQTTLALNAPMALTGRIAKVGLDGLSDTEKALLPPGLTLGNSGYKDRFKQVIGDHLPTPDAIDRYFAAQSTWDDTMAWKANLYSTVNSDTVLVIVVGEFHVQYGGGLPDRLRARLPAGRRVWTASLLNTHGLSTADLQTTIQPSPLYGPRADWLWLGDY